VTLAALVPAKSFGRAKSRLAAVLSEDERRRLARACFTGVLEALVKTDRFSRIAICTDGPEVESLARSMGCEVFRDPEAPAPFSSIVDAGLVRLAESAERALVVMADLPEASAASFFPVVDAMSDVVLVPDAEGLGTSALLVPLPAPFSTAFGNRDSAARHEALARRSGLSFSRVEVPTLARDVDGPLDLLGREALFTRSSR
jgi:2-phospho-L-lactate guanylyltransferase